MGEDNAITLDDLEITITTKDGKQVKKGLLKSTGSTTYSLSTIDTITSLTMPITFEKEFGLQKERTLDMIRNTNKLYKAKAETDEEFIKRITENKDKEE